MTAFTLLSGICTQKVQPLLLRPAEIFSTGENEWSCNAMRIEPSLLSLQVGGASGSAYAHPGFELSFLPSSWS
jgi:hypothetical protein